MGGNDDQSGKASANKAPLSCVSQGEEQGEHGSGKGNEQLTNRAALRKGKWTVSQAVIVMLLLAWSCSHSHTRWRRRNTPRESSITSTRGS